VILVDTSAWVELLNGRWRSRAASGDLLQFATCGPVIQELLQGLRAGPAAEEFRDSLLSLPRLADPVSLSVYLEAAEIYREGRNRGYTIRASTDCLIAAIAIDSGVPVWHKDRDFDHIAAYTRLRTVRLA